MYLLIASGVGLLALPSRLREAIGSSSRASIFNALSVAAVTSWIVGYAIVIGVPSLVRVRRNGKFVLTHGVVYTFAEIGWAVMYGAGGILLACADHVRRWPGLGALVGQVDDPRRGRRRPCCGRVVPALPRLPLGDRARRLAAPLPDQVPRARACDCSLASSPP